MYDREQLSFDEESKKRVVIATPVSDTVYIWSLCEFLALQSPVPMATEGRSLRSGRTLPDPSLPTKVEREMEGGSEEGSDGKGGSGDEEEEEFEVDNAR